MWCWRNSIELTISILFYNYRGISRTIVKEKDQKIAKAGYISGFVFVGFVFLLLAAIIAKFEINEIKNNTPEASGYLGWIFLFLLTAIAWFFYEQRRVKKIVEAGKNYRPGKVFWIGCVLTSAILAGMIFL